MHGKRISDLSSSHQPVTIYKPKRILQGANLYSPNSILVAELDPSVSCKPVDKQFSERALQILNVHRSAEAKANINAIPPLPPSLATNTFAEVLNYLALTFQRWGGLPVTFAKVLAKTENAQGEHIVFESRLDHLATAAGQIAAEVCLHCINPELVTAERIKNMIGEFDRVFVHGRTSQIPFIREAEETGVPWLPLTVDGAILAFGQGSKLKKVHKNFTSNTNLIASRIAADKHTTANMLRAQGIPVPRQVVATSLEVAIEAAQRLEYPVVVKPARSDHGTAVFVDLCDETEVSNAFNEAMKYGPVLVEKLIPGEHHRLMVINGKFRWACKQLPAHVIGDGNQSVRSLIEQTNEACLANDWDPIANDDEALAQLKKQDLTMESVPAKGSRVKLTTQASVSTEESMKDVTNLMHPANVNLAERAAATIDIDIASLDFITKDVNKPYWEVGAAFCGVSITPGLILHEEKIILGEWFPDGEKGRIVSVVVLDSLPDKKRGARIAEQLQVKYSKVCLATMQGLLIDGELASPGNFASYHGLQAALCEPGVNAVVLEIEASDLITNGLGIDRCDLAVFASREESGDQQLAEAARGILATISECVIDNSIIREGQNASSDAKQLAREINSSLS